MITFMLTMDSLTHRADYTIIHPVDTPHLVVTHSPDSFSGLARYWHLSFPPNLGGLLQMLPLEGAISLTQESYSLVKE